MSNTVTVQLQLSFDAPVLSPLLLLQNINLALVDAIESRGLTPAHHPDCPLDSEGATQDASVTEYIELTTVSHCLKTQFNAHTTTTKIESQDVTGIDVTTSPTMKYLLVEIHERNGEKKYTARCLAHCSSEQNNDLVADAMSAPQATDRQSLCAGIALYWYEDYLDDNPYDRDSFWFECGMIAVEVGNVYELSQEHYDLLSLYLSDLTPSDDAIAEAINYKTAAKS